MAAVPPPSEQVRELLQNLKVDPQVQSGEHTEFMQIPPVQEGNPPSNIGNASTATGRVPISNSNPALQGMQGSGMYYATNGYVIPHGFVYDYGHGGEWEENGRYVGVEGMELHSPGLYGENSSVVFHPTGLSYASQPSYNSYSPGPHMPTMGTDGQLYGPSAFQYHGHIYHQSVPPGTQFMPAPSAAVKTELPVLGSREPGPPGVDLSSGGIAARNSLSLGPRPGVPLPAIPLHGPYPRGILPVALHNSVTQDVRAPYEGLRSGAPSWPGPAKIADRRKVPVASASLQTTSSQTLSSATYSTQNIRPAPQMQLRVGSRQSQKVSPAVASPNLGSGVRGRNYPPAARGITSPNGYGRAGRGLGVHTLDSRANGRTWIGVDKSMQQGRGILPLCSGNQNLDILSEQNKGPRTARIRTQRPIPGVSRYLREPGGSSAGTNDVFDSPGKDQYNQPDFRTDYDEARFFVIKSYSEDDVHKSIKYLVWASTPNGNKRLDAAYQDAQVRSATKGGCPIFMFFSVNASGQFCGVAEMTGHVDFSKSMDFWQQDKWNGRFPVKWHIIKDVPNIHFRHVILENNDNKPVTNSRDTQEVKFDQGIEMLNIFKKFTARTSILDDFHFYEARERVLQEKRGRSQMQLQQQLRLVYQSSNEKEQGQAKEASNQARFEKSNDSTIGSESSETGALAEPGVKSSTTAHTGIHPALLVGIPSKTSGENSIKNDGELNADLLVSAVASMKIKEKDGTADAAKSDQHG